MIWKRLIFGLLLGMVGAFFVLPQFLGGSLFAQQSMTVLPVAGMPVQHLPEIDNRPPEPKRISEGDEPEIQSASAIVIDVDSGKVLYEKNPDDPRPIASLTKMTTLSVALEHEPDWEATHVMSHEENALEGARLWVDNGEEVTVEDVFYATLVGSGNNTALALSNIFGGEEAFVQEMNDFVVELGLDHTVFREPTGLSAYNVSTAREVAEIATHAFSQPEIGEYSTQDSYMVHTITNELVRSVTNTNKLLGNTNHTLLGGKTGYTHEALWCLATMAEIQSFPVVVVVLGAPDADARFNETDALLDYVDEQFAWPEPMTQK